jgi:hypothetical protein
METIFSTIQHGKAHYIFYHALTSSGLKVKQLRKLLRQQNKYGLTPLLEALSNLPDSIPAFTRNFDEIFTTFGVWNNDEIDMPPDRLHTFWSILFYIKYTCYNYRYITARYGYFD